MTQYKKHVTVVNPDTRYSITQDTTAGTWWVEGDDRNYGPYLTRQEAEHEAAWLYDH